MYVFAKMLEMGDITYDIVLIARDRDYAPGIEALTRRGIHTVVIGFDDGEYPIELKNETYLFIDLQELLKEMEETIRNTSEES